MVELGGHLATNAGVAISGAAVAVFPTSVNATQATSTDCATTTTTTTSGGDWAVSCLAANTYDVRITCGSSVRWRRYVEEIQVTTYQLGDDGTAYFGAGNDAGIRWSDGDASNHALVIAVGDLSQQVHITDLTAIGTDWARSAGTHPELAIHSNTTPITDYLAIGNHDGTTASIDVVGGTTLSFAIAGNSEASITASGLTLPANSDLLFTGGTGTNDIVLTNGLADALSITDGSADVVVIDTSTAGNVITLTGALTVGVCATGHDVKFFGCLAGAYMLYDESEETLEIRGAAANAATSTGKLLLSTAQTAVDACDVIGSINFQAPLEAGDCDSRLVAAGIRAVAQATFTCAVNATDLIFYTGHSEAATEKFRFTSQGEIGIGGATYGTDGYVLTSGGPGAAVAWEAAASGTAPVFDRVVRTAGNITTTSTTDVDFTGASITFTTGAFPVAYSVAQSFSLSVIDNARFNIDLDDGTLLHGTGSNSGFHVNSHAANYTLNASFSGQTAALSGASHNLQLVWHVDAGTGTVLATTANSHMFAAHEIR
jgi:hypothetical protein